MIETGGRLPLFYYSSCTAGIFLALNDSKFLIPIFGYGFEYHFLIGIKKNKMPFRFI